MFAEKCVDGIEADVERARGRQAVVLLATALNPIIGYARAAELVTAVDERRSIIDLAVEAGYLDVNEARTVLDRCA